jgi:hypothetical protein
LRLRLRCSGRARLYFWIWSVTVVLWLKLAFRPVMVRVVVPVVLLWLVWMVRVEVLVVDGGVKVAVVLAGRPLRLRLTVPVRLLLGEIVIV